MGDMITAFFCLFTLLYVPMRVSDPCESHGLPGLSHQHELLKAKKKKRSCQAPTA